ncbi:MAG: phosphatase PAP2 family protein [Verrucomicrobiales bacterium]|nr:phosphatase PAP2 family protein [Verrucomicrobiales bacterium]
MPHIRHHFLRMNAILGLCLCLGLWFGGFVAESCAATSPSPSQIPAPARAATPSVAVEAWPDPLAGLHRSELRVIERVQSVGGLARVMRVISDLGPGRYMILVMAAILFCIQPQLALRLALLMFAALWLREVLALWLHSPRPYWFGPSVTTWGTVAATRHTFGLPSGHALVGIAVWMFAAAQVRTRWAWVVALGISLAIAVSRVYLGVHFMSDVALGLALGAGLVKITLKFEPALAAGWMNLSPGTRKVAALGLGVALAMVGWLSSWQATSLTVPAGWEAFVRSATNPETTIAQGGAVSGILLSIALLGRWILPMGPWWLRVIRLGIAGVVLRYLVEPAGDWLVDRAGEIPGTMARLPLVFANAGFKAWVVWGFFPWLYLRLGQSRAIPWHRVQRKMGSLLRTRLRD